jgi:hypothetical protein
VSLEPIPAALDPMINGGAVHLPYGVLVQMLWA